MGEAFARHVDAEAAAFVNHVFSLHDTEELQSLVTAARFQDVLVEADTKSLPLPAAAEFLWQYVHSTPLAGAVARVDDEYLASLEQDVVAAWQMFVEDRALTLQVRMVTATARK